MKIIDQRLLDEISREARSSPRRRKNHNLHRSDASCCHRLCNAIEPGTYIQPHRHLPQEKDEAIILLRGRMGMISFDATGEVTGTALLEAGGAVAVDIPHGEFHTVVSLAPGSVFFEAKAGPYAPLSPDEKAPWAPEEGNREAQGYLERLEKLFC